MSKKKQTKLGRKELPKGVKRERIAARVKPETKKRIEDLAEKNALCVGRYLDKHFDNTK